MNRTYRKLASWIGIVAVVFTQLAVSAYACPLSFQNAGNAGEAPEAVSLSEATSSAPEFISPSLCQKHCENGQQNINDTPQSLAFVALEPAFVISLVMDPPAPFPVAAISPSLLHATSPPLAIRNCCFRI